jgi:hypothetical protein
MMLTEVEVGEHRVTDEPTDRIGAAGGFAVLIKNLVDKKLNAAE